MINESNVVKGAAQEAVAVVSAETYNSDGTSDIIKPALPIGTKLYAAPVAAAQEAVARTGHQDGPRVGCDA